ncbi:MAG: helix-turn-helix domain-containing protein [Oscillospiraceae bacterium]|nr:helix-turn-helix domain-containing protein [Oscillospiraceae bacterium]
MSNRTFQSVLVQFTDATDRMLGVIDADGSVIGCSSPAYIGESLPDAMHRLSAAPDSVVVSENKTFKLLKQLSGFGDYAVFAEGEDDTARCICMMLCVALNNAKASNDEKFDRAAFVKNVITDNILPGDVYIRAKELHFAADLRRAVLLIRQCGKPDVAAIELVQSMLADRQQDYVLSINETDIAVVKQVSADAEQEILQLAESVRDRLRNELDQKTVIGIGTVADHLRELADSFKEAQVAIEVGKVFDTDKTIMSYDKLGIGRLIYQLPTTLCEIFLSEVFRKGSIDSLNHETLFTIDKFFENNLNVSETSRKLFVHRNTLVYRLEKIKKMTGLDLRQFDHAIVFKVALMVKKYLSSRDNRLM